MEQAAGGLTVHPMNGEKNILKKFIKMLDIYSSTWYTT